MISFIVPAHNEELLLPATLEAIHASARAANQDYEVIVVNDSSTDRTAEIARGHAKVLNVNHRQIAATRNSGARAALGDRFFFVDADTTVNAEVLKSALSKLDQGAVGGGAQPRFEGDVPLFARLLLLWLGFFMRLASLSGGAFMFCTREAFQAAGGFNEALYGAEDAAFSASLKQIGRFVVLRESLLTSGRRVRSMGGLQTLALLLRVGFAPGTLRNRSSVEKVWYNSNRAGDARAVYSLADRISNAAALVILFVLVTIPLWVIPWPHWLSNGPASYVRLAARIIISHVSLVLWPCAIFMTRTLFKPQPSGTRLKTFLIIVGSVYIAEHATIRVFTLWRHFLHWIIA
jgi:glycosyltransferase involved in cell wall biosynthesis